MKFFEIKYERIDFDEVIKALDTISVELENAKTGEEAFEVHKKFYKLNDRVITQSTIAQIRSDIDMTDEFYSKEQEFYDENMPKYNAKVVEYKKKLFYSKHRSFLEEKIGKVAFKNIELAMKAIDDKLIPLMQEENKFAREYNKILAKAKIDWEGEKLNLSLMTPYLGNEDREIRQRAWKKYTEFFEANKTSIEDYYDKLVKNRTEQGKLMGYDNFLELGYARMNRNCYGKKEIEEFRKQVKKYIVPLATKFHERKRERLGLDKLSYIDEGVYFKNGNPAPIGKDKEILDSGLKMYKELSKETDKFMTAMCEGDYFDVLGRKNKKTGGYMTMLPDYNMPFVFANFNATYTDIDVITHECGHAFQGFITADYPIKEHNDITMETAEIHSMSMEFFTEPWMKLFFGDRAKDYVDMHLESMVCFIPYGTMVDEFQNIVYENPNMTPKERNNLWRELEKQYKPHLNYEGNAYMEEGCFWHKQHHIFDLPFYYIDYCIAAVNALQYKVLMNEDFENAWKSYLEFCKLSASDFFNNLIKKAGLKNPFGDGCMENIARKL